MNELLGEEKDFVQMRIFLKVFFGLMIFILVMGMTKELRQKISDVPEKEKPTTVLWQTEL